VQADAGRPAGGQPDDLSTIVFELKMELAGIVTLIQESSFVQPYI